MVSGKGKIVIFLFSIFLFNPLCFSSWQNVRRGNNFFREENYDGALREYNQAKLSLGSRDILEFNIGSALYKKAQYEEALEHFEKALLTGNKQLEAKSNFNLGNSYYQLGRLKENTDLRESVEFYKKALSHYKRAIELNQKDLKAKYNYELVEKQLNSLLDRLNKEESASSQKEGQTQDSSQEGSSQKENKSFPGESKKENSSVGKENAEEKEPDNEGEKSEEELASSDIKKDNDKEKSLSREEALMILRNYNEKKNPFLKKETTFSYPPVEKDW